MLEHVPHWLGHLLRNVRAGHAKILAARLPLDGVGTFTLSSPAFADEARLPERFTADGAGVSPPLVWRGLPPGTQALALVVEDPDAPTPEPLVHALAWLPGGGDGLPEGALHADGDGGPQDVGRNSFGREGWLPPDPPTGHGSHDYVFQLFALSGLPERPPSPGRAALAEAIAGRVLGLGLLVGRYSRGEEVTATPGGVTAPA